MALKRGARMVLDHIEATLKDIRDATYVARRKAREAGHVVKSNPVYSRELIEEADDRISAALDDIARIERMMKDNLEPLLQRTDHVRDETRLAEALERLDEIEDRLKRLEQRDDPPLRAVR